MDNGISGIAGRVEDLEPRLPTQSLIGELAAIHTARKPDIRKEQADFAVRVQQPKRGRPISRTQNGVSKIADDLDRVIAHIGIILDDQHQFPSTARKLTSFAISRRQHLRCPR